MKLNHYPVTLFAIFSLLIANCTQSPSSQVAPSKPETKILESSTAISIQDTEGAAIANAQILIGDSLNSPFSNNLYTADAKGLVAVPTDWTTTTSLNISANGYITASYLHTAPGAGIFKLRKQNLSKSVEYSGSTIGYPPFDDYSQAHISLVFEALKKSELANFSLSQMISPEIDTFSVFGSKVSVPSNLAIPDQILAYILPFRFSKPNFHLPLPVQSDHVMVGLHAQFAVADLVKGSQNKASIFEMINYFNFTSFSQQLQHIDSSDVSRDLDISSQQLYLKNHLQAQKFDPSLSLLVISCLDQNSGMLPLDIKSGASGGSIDVNTLSSKHSSEKIIGVLKPQNSSSGVSGAAQELMSIAVHDASDSVLPDQLNMLSAPSFSSNTIKQTLPTATASKIAQAGIYYSLNAVTSESIAGVVIESKTPLWDVYNPNWEELASLPNLPSQMTTLNPNATSPHRWIVNLLGQDHSEVSGLGPDRLKSVNYFSKAAIDLK